MSLICQILGARDRANPVSPLLLLQHRSCLATHYTTGSGGKVNSYIIPRSLAFLCLTCVVWSWDLIQSGYAALSHCAVLTF